MGEDNATPDPPLMIASIAEHYDAHLAEHYSWLFGGLPERARENKAYFESVDLLPSANGRALDLGSGSGFQSIALAELGFDVTAVDLSKKLLTELRNSAFALPITTVNADLLDYLGTSQPGFEVCVCMGDTLTHLASFGDVQRVIREVFRVMAPGGRFALAFRDMTQALEGVDRFIPVRADENTVFTCFLEYEGDHVRVYDLIHQRVGPAWELKKSVYRKLRIGRDWARKRLVEAGFSVLREEDSRGMVTFILGKS